jgi:hypothetical protein
MDIAFAFLLTCAFWALIASCRGIKNRLRTKRLKAL